MGGAIASRLLDGGHELVVWNRSPERGRELVDRGARRGRSLGAAVRQAEVVITSLSDDTAVMAVATEQDGAIRQMPPGAVLVDMSTVSPTTSRELAQEARGRFVDCPVLGGPLQVTSGAATLLVGGAQEQVDRVAPALNSVSPRQWRCPGVGSGAAAKLIANLTMMDGLAVLAEAIATAEAVGLPDSALENLLDSPLVPPMLKSRIPMMRRRDYRGWFAARMGLKDTRLAIGLAAEQGLELPVTAAVARLFERAIALGLGEQDIASLRAVLEHR